MPHASRTPAPDQEQRDVAVRERGRNVLIDAGAGTGKTTILVDRLVEMVAPTSGMPPLPIGRLAAITFTRKAAGELRLRIRERLLAELAAPSFEREHQERLHDALAGLDTAHVGTIHSFADRLLRLRPVDAQLSPGYEVAEDEEALVQETYEVLMHAVEARTLADELEGHPAAARADEVTRFLLLALRDGLRAQSSEREWDTQYGLDALVAGFLGLRDVPPEDPPSDVRFDAEAFHAKASELVRLAAPVAAGSDGARWLRNFADDLQRQRDTTEPFALYRLVRRHVDRQPRDVTMRDTFAGDKVAWKVWKRYADGGGEPAALRDELLAPLHRWLALRLLRLFPVVVALYEKVKARRRALDQLDLLAKLRDLLAENLVARRELGGLFDHIFVDEFQDTDPLQAEIVLFLCEREPRATRWTDVELRPGALTLVGDPKQSIYRFRRADIAMYDHVRSIVARSPHLPIRLSANFRSVPPLIDWLNDRFSRILGVDPGRAFDPATGRVFQQPLDPGRPGASTPPVHVLRYDLPGGDGKADEYRALEGRALARYLRWLVEVTGVQIEDPVDGQRRPVRFGDVAILTISTWKLELLFPSLDAEDIPYASRGGKLFLGDPRHRQFLLGLRAIADRDDGVAEAALLRPPFFAVDLAELARERSRGPTSPPISSALGSAPGDPRHSSILASGSGDASDGDDGSRVREARELVRELRRQRFDRAPGATARDLLERTAFARTVALRPNGAQRLARLRELCLVLEQQAARDGLDYDAVTAEMRQWVSAPIQLDPPHPVGTEAVQVLTVHQAKGLEFPVVVLWDGMCQWTTRVQQSPWRLERDGPGWIMTLDGLKWEEPAGLGLRQTEQSYLEAERRRVVYVAATRARDLLVVPQAGALTPSGYICDDLLGGARPDLVCAMETFLEEAVPTWAEVVWPPSRQEISSALDVEPRAGERWAEAGTGAARPRFRPVGVSHAAPVGRAHDLPDSVDAAPQKPREGRFGAMFGNTVHQAIGLALRDPTLLPTDAIRRAVADSGLTEHLDDAVADVERALEALRLAGVPREIGAGVQTEFPVAGILWHGELAVGYIDLVAATIDRLVVLDFKTDPAPVDAVDRTYPGYVAQVRAYARLLAHSGPAPALPLRCGLLFTEDGRTRWVD